MRTETHRLPALLHAFPDKISSTVSRSKNPWLLRCLLAAALALVPALAQVTVDVPVSDDAWVNSNSPTRNYGSKPTMKLRDTRRLAYLKFHVEGIPGVIQSAAIRFQSIDSSGSMVAYNVDDEEWTETDITWRNRPPTGTLAGTATITAGDWNEIPVTASVGPNGTFSFALEQASSTIGEISSKEGTASPVLRIVYLDVNLPPTANPESYTIQHDTQRTVPAPGLLANDSDPNDDPLSARVVTPPSHGTLSLAADGSFTYLPDPGFEGSDSFQYEAFDGELASDPVTVTLEVLAEGVGQLTSEELDRIATDLGVTLTLDQQLDLAAIVKPLVSETWRTDAEARIDQLRKADIGITVTDADGFPLPGATVEVRLKRKPFRFGGVLDLQLFSGAQPLPITPAHYKQQVPALFDAVGLNNGLKPKLRAGNEAHLPDFFTWCQAQELPVRGHLLLWPGGTHLSAGIEALVSAIEATEADPTQQQIDELRAAVDAEISGWASQWTGVYEWDVLNEILSNQRLQNILGREEMVRWFQLSQTANAPADRLLNDFQLVSGRNTNRLDAFRGELDFLLANGAPLTGIGFQSRYKWQREHPDTILARLDQLSAPVNGVSLPMRATEFEIVENPGIFEPDETLRASMTEEIMTTYFSHPAVESLFAWDYLRENSPSSLLDGNGVPKLNGLVWYYINRIRYDTRATFTTDASGRVDLRGFMGDYEITVTGSGTPVVLSSTVAADTQIPVPTDFSGTPRIIIPAIEDAATNSAAPEANNGAFRNIPLRQGIRTGYLKFDLSSLAGPVTSATLHLFPHDSVNPANIESDRLEVRPLADPAATWSETDLCWNNAPPVSTAPPVGSGAADPATGAYSITIDPSVIAAGILTLALEETGNSYGELASSETLIEGAVPVLEIIVGTPDTDQDGIPDDLDPDDDGDLIPDDHETALGLDPLDPADALADPDGDGIATVIEYMTGHAPHLPTPSPEILSLTPAAPPATGFILTFSTRQEMAGSHLCLDHSLDAGAWSTTHFDQLAGAGIGVTAVDIVTTSDALGAIDTYEVSLDPPASSGLFRLKTVP